MAGGANGRTCTGFEPDQCYPTKMFRSVTLADEAGLVAQMYIQPGHKLLTSISLSIDNFLLHVHCLDEDKGHQRHMRSKGLTVSSKDADASILFTGR